MGLFGNTERTKAAPDDSARRERLEQLTATARRGMAAFAEVGAALDSIREEELWRLVAPSWAEWCSKSLGLTERRVSQLVEASRTCNTLASMGLKIPSSERVARELAGLEPEKQADAWREATELAGGAEPSADDVAKAARKRKPRKAGRARTAKPVSLRVPGAAVRVVPRRNGWVSLVAALEHALELARQRDESDKRGREAA
jgi:hypothetical protein